MSVDVVALPDLHRRRCPQRLDQQRAALRFGECAQLVRVRPGVVELAEFGLGGDERVQRRGPVGQGEVGRRAVRLGGVPASGGVVTERQGRSGKLDAGADPQGRDAQLVAEFDDLPQQRVLLVVPALPTAGVRQQPEPLPSHGCVRGIAGPQSRDDGLGEVVAVPGDRGGECQRNGGRLARGGALGRGEGLELGGRHAEELHEEGDHAAGRRAGAGLQPGEERGGQPAAGKLCLGKSSFQAQCAKALTERWLF
jgi:hypothetical protein